MNNIKNWKRWLVMILAVVLILPGMSVQTAFAQTAKRLPYAQIGAGAYTGEAFKKDQDFLKKLAQEVGITTEEFVVADEYAYPGGLDSKKYKGENTVYFVEYCYTDSASMYILTDADHRIIDYYKGFYDVNGYNKEGYDARGYDPEGYNKSGYDENGLNAQGWDREGYDRDGYNAQGWDRDGYDRNGYDRDGYNRNGYDKNGYNAQGYDADGYNGSGLDLNGRTEGQKQAQKYKATGKTAASLQKGYAANRNMYWGYKLCGPVELAIRDTVLLEKKHYSRTGEKSISKPSKVTIKNGKSRKYKGTVVVYTYQVKGTSGAAYKISVVCDSKKRIIDSCYVKSVKVNGGKVTRAYDKKGYDLYGYNKSGYDVSGYDKNDLKKDGKTILMKSAAKKTFKLKKKTDTVAIRYASSKAQYYQIVVSGMPSKVKAITYTGGNLTGKIKPDKIPGTFLQQSPVKSGKSTIYVKAGKSLKNLSLKLKNTADKSVSAAGLRVTVTPVSGAVVRQRASVRVSTTNMIGYEGDKNSFFVTATEPVDISYWWDKDKPNYVLGRQLQSCSVKAENGRGGSSVEVAVDVHVRSVDFSYTGPDVMYIWPHYYDEITVTVTGRYSGKKQTVKIRALPSRELVAYAAAHGIDPFR